MANNNQEGKSLLPSNPIDYDPVTRIRETNESAQYIRSCIQIAAVCITMPFGWLKLRDLDLINTLLAIPPDLVFKITMAIYFLSWVQGLLCDTTFLESVFVHSPPSTHVKVGGGLIGISLILVFLMLLFSVDSHQAFSRWLLFFFLLNIGCVIYITKAALQEAIDRSRTYYKNENRLLDLEKLKLVNEWFLAGKWQIYRFLIGILFSGLIVYFSSEKELLEGSYWLIKQHGDSVSSTLFFIFVLVIEGWIWFVRMRVKGKVTMLSELGENYVLSEKLS
jgi:hypothetical protein